MVAKQARVVVKFAEWWLEPTTPNQYGENPEYNCPESFVLVIFTPRACAKGKVISRVVIVVIMDTKIAKSGDLGT